MTEPHGVTDATRKYIDERLNVLQAEAKRKQWDDPELVLDQWYKYEQIAMHFNDLLMRFRTQALAGLAGRVANSRTNSRRYGWKGSCPPAGESRRSLYLWFQH